MQRKDFPFLTPRLCQQTRVRHGGWDFQMHSALASQPPLKSVGAFTVDFNRSRIRLMLNALKSPNIKKKKIREVIQHSMCMSFINFNSPQLPLITHSPRVHLPSVLSILALCLCLLVMCYWCVDVYIMDQSVHGFILA